MVPFIRRRALALCLLLAAPPSCGGPSHQAPLTPRQATCDSLVRTIKASGNPYPGRDLAAKVVIPPFDFPVALADSTIRVHFFVNEGGYVDSLTTAPSLTAYPAYRRRFVRQLGKMEFTPDTSGGCYVPGTSDETIRMTPDRH